MELSFYQREFDLEDVTEFVIECGSVTDTVISTEERASERAFAMCYAQRPAAGVTLRHSKTREVLKHFKPEEFDDESTTRDLSPAQVKALEYVDLLGEISASGLLGVYRAQVCEYSTVGSLLSELRELTSERVGAPLEEFCHNDGTILFRKRSER